MTAHKMNDGRWCMWLDLGSDPASGHRIRRRVEAKTKRDAEMKAKALRERFDRGENILDKPPTLGMLLDDWIATIARARPRYPSCGRVIFKRCSTTWRTRSHPRPSDR